jgi:hypothetical protein
MANYSPIHRIIENAISLDLGNPNYAISEKEALLKDSAVMLGCMDYYRIFPMPSMYMTTFNTYNGGNTSLNWAGLAPAYMENGNMYVDFDTLLTQGRPGVPADQLEHAHFLGILRIDRPYWASWSNPACWDRYLLGFQVGSNNYDITKTLLSNTLDVLSTGQPEYMINTMKRRVEILPPWGLGQLSIVSAIGFDTPEYVEMSKADYLCKFISLRFIEAVIQARSGVQLTADFTISTNALEARLAKLREEVDSIKNVTPLHLAQWS